MLDGRALLKDDPQAADRLLKAAEGGSTFALMVLQAYMAGSPKGNPEFAYSLSRVMEMMGDTRVALARDMSFRQTPLQRCVLVLKLKRWFFLSRLKQDRKNVLLLIHVRSPDQTGEIQL